MYSAFRIAVFMEEFTYEMTLPSNGLIFTSSLAIVEMRLGVSREEGEEFGKKLRIPLEEALNLF